MQTWGAELSHTHKSVAGRPAGAGIFASLAVRPRGASGKVDGLVDRVELRLTLERLGARSIEPPASILFLGQAPEGQFRTFWRRRRNVRNCLYKGARNGSGDFDEPYQSSLTGLRKARR
jgi:hypothetical protein